MSIKARGTINTRTERAPRTLGCLWRRNSLSLSVCLSVFLSLFLSGCNTVNEERSKITREHCLEKEPSEYNRRRTFDLKNARERRREEVVPLKRAETLWGKVSNGLWTCLRIGLPSFLEESFALSYTLPSKHFLKFLFLQKKKKKKRKGHGPVASRCFDYEEIYSQNKILTRLVKWNDKLNISMFYRWIECVFLSLSLSLCSVSLSFPRYGIVFIFTIFLLRREKLIYARFASPTFRMIRLWKKSRISFWHNGTAKQRDTSRWSSLKILDRG